MFCCIKVSTEMEEVKYQIIISEEILQKIKKYKTDILAKTADPGKYLHDKIVEVNLNNTTLCEFIQILLSTKKPRIFAESEVRCNGTDWNSTEFSILGGIIVMEARAYDNGVWYAPMSIKHNDPLDIELLYTPGVMMNTGGTGINNPDYNDVVKNKEIDQENYNALVESRLLPLFSYANYKAEHKKRALIILPGIGCGNFAGAFRGQMEVKLDGALQNMIMKYKFPNIKGVQFGLHENSLIVLPKIISDIVYEVQGNGLPQLSHPEEYGMEYKDCKIYKVVAWDHVSLPGNDFFFHNTRATDDGVSAAATNSMKVITGIKGLYKDGKYVPPSKYRDWEDVVKSEGIELIANENNVKVVTSDGQYHDFDVKFM